jgi:hypothetical protein
METKNQIIQNLHAFISQRSGMYYMNYGGSREAFLRDYRPMLQAGKHARELLGWIAWHESITADDIIAASKSAYSGRLEITNNKVAYTTGQYFPTEYRNAVCVVLATAIWRWFVANGSDPRKAARKEFGRSIANRWFN